MRELTREEKKAVVPKFAHFEVGDFGEHIGKTGQVHKICGHATVAALRLPEAYHYGVALCSPEDNFCRAEGRERALQKLHNPERHKLTTGEVILTKDDERTRNSVIAEGVVYRVLEDLYDNIEKCLERWWDDDELLKQGSVRLKSKKVRSNGND